MLIWLSQQICSGETKNKNTWQMQRQRCTSEEGSIFQKRVDGNAEVAAVLSSMHLIGRTYFLPGSSQLHSAHLPACLLFLQVPQPLLSSLPSASTHFPHLSILAYLGLTAFHNPNQTHQPPADSHQHFSGSLLFCSLKIWLGPNFF